MPGDSFRGVETKYIRVALYKRAKKFHGLRPKENPARAPVIFGLLTLGAVTGGGPGLMQAANEGAAAVDTGERNRSIGIRVELPFEQQANPYVEQAFEHKTFFTRLHHFVLTSDAFVVVPGGIGTVLELMMVWQLLQVKHVHDAPLILVGKMWTGLLDWATTQLAGTQPPLANPEDMLIPRVVHTADEAITLLREHHTRWAAAWKLET